MSETVQIRSDGALRIVTIDRPERRNAVDLQTAEALIEAFRAFDADQRAAVAVLTGAGDHFCGGADLKGLADQEAERLSDAADGPMGPTRLHLSKPVIAAIEGYAVGGGLELALWCDLRVAAVDAVLGVFNRRFGVPLVDGGTVRLPRLIGQSQAMDLILTGRAVPAEEALAMGLVNRVVDSGTALDTALELARQLAQLPQACLLNDRLSVYEQWALPEEEALRNEHRRGLDTVATGEPFAGARRFSAGEGRRGERLGDA